MFAGPRQIVIALMNKSGRFSYHSSNGKSVSWRRVHVAECGGFVDTPLKRSTIPSVCGCRGGAGRCSAGRAEQAITESMLALGLPVFTQCTELTERELMYAYRCAPDEYCRWFVRFIASWNMDLNACWVIGKLRSLAGQHGWRTVFRDVLTPSLHPSWLEFVLVLARHCHLLVKFKDLTDPTWGNHGGTHHA